MNKFRYYIQKGEDSCDDLWAEVVAKSTENPLVQICGNGEEGKIIILSLTIPSMIRLTKAGQHIIDNLDPMTRNVWEDQNDSLGDR